MIVNLKYENNPYLVMRSVSVIGSFNDFVAGLNPMQLSDGYWQTEIELPPGEHKYKFFINGEIKLNDPMANMYLPDEKEELWSTIIINEQNQRLYNNEQYTVNLEDYAVTNTVTESPVAVNKKRFDKTVDKQVVIRFEFNNITGLHAVTVVWYDSYGRVYEFGENSLYSDEESTEQSVSLWFWIDLDDAEKECQEGVWTLKLFIDGSYILEDQVTITRVITYSSKGLYNSFT